MDGKRISFNEALLAKQDDSTWSEVFIQSIAYSTLQAPLTGAAQLTDYVSGAGLSRHCKVFSAPREAEPFSASGHVVQVGCMLGASERNEIHIAADNTDGDFRS